METCNRKQGGIVRRIRPEGVTPLELWDLRVGDGILWDWASHDSFGRVLRLALESLHSGGGVTRSDGPVPSCISGFTGLYLTGGATAGLAGALDGTPWHVWFAADGQYAAELGGNALLSEAGMTGWVVDLGQKALKISSGRQRWLYPRDYNMLPVRDDDSPPVDSQREALRTFLARALCACLADASQQPQAIAWALPSRLDDNGVPEGSSYIGMSGDRTLIGDSLARAGIAPDITLVLNDAELAAVSARLDARVRGKTLVLTVGFGVGAALLEA